MILTEQISLVQGVPDVTVCNDAAALGEFFNSWEFSLRFEHEPKLEAGQWHARPIAPTLSSHPLASLTKSLNPRGGSMSVALALMTEGVRVVGLQMYNLKRTMRSGNSKQSRNNSTNVLGTFFFAESVQFQKRTETSPRLNPSSHAHARCRLASARQRSTAGASMGGSSGRVALPVVERT